MTGAGSTNCFSQPQMPSRRVSIRKYVQRLLARITDPKTNWQIMAAKTLTIDQKHLSAEESRMILETATDVGIKFRLSAGWKV